MRAVLVMVGDVFGKQALQMPLVKSNHMVEQLATAACHPALGNTILPGTFEGGPHGVYLQGSNGCRASVPYFASRSWIRNLGAAPKGNASRNTAASRHRVPKAGNECHRDERR